MQAPPKPPSPLRSTEVVSSVSVVSSLVLLSDVESSDVAVLVLLVRLVDVLDSEVDVDVTVCAAALFTAAEPETDPLHAPTARMVAAARANAAVIVERDLMICSCGSGADGQMDPSRPFLWGPGLFSDPNQRSGDRPSRC
jgi:hypothetical protein